MTDFNETSSDHDLLVRVDEKLLGLAGAVSELRDGTIKQLADHETRLRHIESSYVPDGVYSPAHQALIKSIDSVKKIIYMAVGAWIFFTFLAGLLIKFIK